MQNNGFQLKSPSARTAITSTGLARRLKPSEFPLDVLGEAVAEAEADADVTAASDAITPVVDWIACVPLEVLVE